MEINLLRVNSRTNINKLVRKIPVISRNHNIKVKIINRAITKHHNLTITNQIRATIHKAKVQVNHLGSNPVQDQGVGPINHMVKINLLG